MNEQQRYDEHALMRIALREAQAALPEDVPVGAAIMKDGVLLAAAHNRREAHADPTAHAEMLALRQAAQRLGHWRLDGCIMAVTLEPCPMCAAAIRTARLAKVVYGARDVQAGACGSVLDLSGFPGLGPEVAVEGGVEGDACAHMLAVFFETRRCSPKTGVSKRRTI